MALGSTTEPLRTELATALAERPFELRFWDGSRLPSTRPGGDGGPVFEALPRRLDDVLVRDLRRPFARRRAAGVRPGAQARDDLPQARADAGRAGLALERAGLRCEHVEAYAEHYARTLAHWAERLDANAVEATRLAGAQRMRIWRLYLRAARSGFQTGFTSIYQVRCRRA